MKNVKVSMSEGNYHMASISFELKDGRYHIWVNNKILLEKLFEIVKQNNLWELALEAERLRKIKRNLDHKKAVRENRIEENAKKLYNIVSSYSAIIKSAINAFSAVDAEELNELIKHVEEPVEDLYEIKYED